MANSVSMRENTWPRNLLNEVFLEDTTFPITEKQLTGLEYGMSLMHKRMREIVQLRFHDGEKIKTIAERQGVSEYTVRGDIMRAVFILRREPVCNYLKSGYGGPQVAQSTSPLEMPIPEANFSTHVFWTFRQAGIKTMGDVAKMTVDEIQKLPCVGPKTCAEIVEATLSVTGIDIRKNTASEIP